MRKTLSIILSALMCALALCSCADSGVFGSDEILSVSAQKESGEFDYSKGAEPPSAYNTYAGAVTELGLKLFRATSAEENESFLISPASAALELSMLTNAVSGSAKQELLLAFGGELSADYLNQCSAYFKSRMETVAQLNSKNETSEKSVRIKSALLADKDVNIKNTFLQTAADYYGYDFSVLRYDFSSENAKTKLNAFFENGSKDAEFSPEKNTAALISKTSVTDSWLDGYAKEDIIKGSFNGKETSFLRSNESYIKSDLAQGIIKYTEANPLKLFLLMPNEGTSVEDYIKRFDLTEFNTLTDSVDVTKPCTAEIPEFSVDADGTAKSLKPAAEKCGLYTLFTEDAKLSSLSYTDGLMLSDMVEIEPEFKLNAAGINNGDVAVKTESTVTKTDKTIRFDKPFIFMLIDNETSIPVLMGVQK